MTSTLPTVTPESPLSPALAQWRQKYPLFAIAIAVLRGTAQGADVARQICGAQNDYNARGNGSTISRRVLRDSAWTWVSGPASRGRYLAADRHDTQYGDVYEGEIVASYTLGRSGGLDTMYLVIDTDKPLVVVAHAKIRSGYRLTLPDGTTIDVTDPSWR